VASSPAKLVTRARDHPASHVAHRLVILGVVVSRITQMVQTGLYEVEQTRIASLHILDQLEEHMFDGNLASAGQHGSIGHLSAFLED
jgi:hypothetical protein